MVKIDPKLAILALAIGVSYLVCSNLESADAVKSGEVTLECLIGDQYKVIDPAKVVDYNAETGSWIFTNGYASNCITK